MEMNGMDQQQNQNGYSVKEQELIRQLMQSRLEQKAPLEFESFDGYELPPRTQFSMLKKPAVSIKNRELIFNMACIRMFEGVKHVVPIVHPQKRRLSVVMCTEEESASVEWARFTKREVWVNKDIVSIDFVENLYRLMDWHRNCRYKVLGRVANSNKGLILMFDLAEAIMFPAPTEYVDKRTGEVKKRQLRYFPDEYKDRIGKSYNDYFTSQQLNLFESLEGYNGQTYSDANPGTGSLPVSSSLTVDPFKPNGGNV